MLTEPQPKPEEIFLNREEPTHALEKSEFEYLADEASELVDHWQDLYDIALKYPTWQEFSSHVTEQYQANEAHAEKSYADDPETLIALKHLNSLFGTLPTKLIDCQATLLRARAARQGQDFKYKQADIDLIQGGGPADNRLELFRQPAEWQADAIWSLLRFRNAPIGSDNRIGVHSGVEPTIATAFVDAVTKASRKGLASPSIAEKEASITLSGVYGAVKAARIGHAAKLHVALPPSNWDAEGKIDMLFHLPLSSGRLVVPTQIKAKTEHSPISQFEFGAEVTGAMDAQDIKHWQCLREYCDDIKKLPSWSQGVDIRPRWATIYDANFDVFGWRELLEESPKAEDVQRMQQSILKGV